VIDNIEQKYPPPFIANIIDCLICISSWYCDTTQQNHWFSYTVIQNCRRYLLQSHDALQIIGFTKPFDL